MKRALLFLLLLGLAGCAAMGGQLSSAPPTGATLVLLKELVIPAGESGVYIQDGEIKSSFWGVRQYYPFCRLEVDASNENARTVKPGEFIVVDVRQDVLYAGADEPLRVAQAGLVLAGDAVSHRVYTTFLRLGSDTQPDVNRLTCKRWAYPQDWPVPPDTDEIRRTLAGVFSLRLPQAPR